MVFNRDFIVNFSLENILWALFCCKFLHWYFHQAFFVLHFSYNVFHWAFYSILGMFDTAFFIRQFLSGILYQRFFIMSSSLRNLYFPLGIIWSTIILMICFHVIFFFTNDICHFSCFVFLIRYSSSAMYHWAFFSRILPWAYKFWINVYYVY